MLKRTGMRLFGAYAVLALVPIAVIGLVLARTIRSDLEGRGMEEATSVARAVSVAAVEPILSGDSLVDGPTRAERARLQATLPPLLRRGQALKLRLRDRAGHVVFDASDPNRAPYGPEDDEVGEAIHDGIVRILTRLDADAVDGGTDRGPRAVEVYLPLRADGAGAAVGALEIYVPYESIHESIDAAYWRMVGVLAGGLLFLWATLGLVSWSVIQRLRRSARERIEAARTDPVTGLGNRRAFSEALAQRLQAPDALVTIVKMDIDRFGEINESLGHANGDAFLRHTGEVIGSVLGPRDVVTRNGGDEFGVILTDLDGRGSNRVIDAIRRAMIPPIRLDGVEVSAELTMGRAVGHGGDDHTEVMRRAALSLRAAKGERVALVDYEPGLERFDTDRLSLVSELRRAIAEDQLVLHYQPKIDVATGDVAGVEALVRWEHPARGLLLPGAFLPVAESTEVIGALTTWVLDAACRQAAAWHADGRDLPVAVNISARSLRETSLADEVFAALSRHSIPAELLSIEVTETAVIADPARAAATLRRLADRGVRVSIDDFGVGYTSISHLERLPIDELKIDRQFVTHLAGGGDRAAIARGVISLGHGLDLLVVAEGVEDPETLTQLRALGCDLAQGFGIARPAPADEFDAWRAAHDARAAGRQVAGVSPSAS